jgi:hypothetical protein
MNKRDKSPNIQGRKTPGSIEAAKETQKVAECPYKTARQRTRRKSAIP